MAKLEKHWNIDDLELGQMYIVEHGSVWAHRWDEDTEDFYEKYERIEKGSVLLLVETDIEITWVGKSDPDFWGRVVSKEKNDIFHSFIIDGKTLLLNRVSLYCLEPWQYSKTVQTFEKA